MGFICKYSPLPLSPYCDHMSQLMPKWNSCCAVGDLALLPQQFYFVFTTAHPLCMLEMWSVIASCSRQPIYIKCRQLCCYNMTLKIQPLCYRGLFSNFTHFFGFSLMKDFFLYKSLFSPHVIFTLQHLQTLSSWLEFVQTQLCLKKDDIWDIGIHPVLNSPTGNEGKRGKNKMWVNISLYSIQYFLVKYYTPEVCGPFLASMGYGLK